MMDILLKIVGDDGSKMSKDKKAFVEKIMMIVMSVLFYIVVSISLVFLNKFIYTWNKYEFPYPLVVTWFQLLVALALIIVGGFAGRRVQALSFMPMFEFNFQKALTILPLTLIYLGMLTFNNLCLSFVGVFFYQVARSLTIFFNIIFTYVILHQSTSHWAKAACSVVFMGFLMGTKGDVNANVWGITFGLLSSIFVSLNSIYVKRMLFIVNNDHWILLIYNTTMASVILIPFLFISGEFQKAITHSFLFNWDFIFINILTGIIGWLINISIFMLIRYTSPLTNNVVGTLKACIQSLLSAVIFDDTLTPLALMGTAVVIVGSGWYSGVRYMEMNRKSGVAAPKEDNRDVDLLDGDDPGDPDEEAGFDLNNNINGEEDDFIAEKEF